MEAELNIMEITKRMKVIRMCLLETKLCLILDSNKTYICFCSGGIAGSKGLGSHGKSLFLLGEH